MDNLTQRATYFTSGPNWIRKYNIEFQESMSDLVTKFESLIISKYPVSFTKEQSAQAAQWESVLKSGQIQPHLDQLNLVLRDNTFIVSTLYPTSTDVHVFEVALPLIKDLVASSKDVKSTYTTYRHILRWIDYM